MLLVWSIIEAHQGLNSVSFLHFPLHTFSICTVLGQGHHL